MSCRNDEMIRRLRLGNLRTLFRHRYGPTLPDDDAGREDLLELLLPISLGSEPDLKMRYAIEIWAPWMGKTRELIDQINQMPLWQRKPKAGPLGRRLNVTYREREELKLWTIAPCDVNEKGMELLRKRKKRERMRRMRQRKGSKSRREYEGNTISRTKPWLTLGISRATWYRQQRETSPCQVKLTKAEHTPVSPQQAQHLKKESAEKEVTTSIKSQTAPETEKPKMPATDTAHELLARTCLTAAEQNGNSNDLRGMPADLSRFYPQVPSYEWLGADRSSRKPAGQLRDVA
jgi:hypothetical protein